MGKQDHQYTQSKESPLISVSHPSRYLEGKKSTDVNYALTEENVHIQPHNKNNVVMSNLTYTHQNQIIRRLQPKLEKTRTKSLNMQGDETGVFERFKEKGYPVQNNYYILCDLEDDMEDTYFMDAKPVIPKEASKPFTKAAKTHNLGLFPNEKKEPISKDLTNANNRLIRNVDNLKKV